MAEPKWMQIAKSEMGVKRIPGKRHNRKIIQYFRDVGHSWVKNDETAWCAAFVGSCLERSGIPSTKSLVAKSYLKWGKPTKSPKPGTVVVMNRPGADPNSWKGHIGFYVRETDRYVYVLGGNQKGSVNIQAFPKSLVRGYREPEIHDPNADRDNDPAFDHSLELVLMVEGGYSDHPNDPGGKTYRGITLRNYAFYKGVQLTAANEQELLNQLLNISDKEIADFYWKMYWEPCKCYQMPDGLSLFVFDTAVLHGPSIAKRVLQEALGVEVDGIIGPITLNAAEECDPPTVLRRLRDIRIKRLRGSKNWGTFGRGWTNRINAMFEEAIRAAGYVIDSSNDNAPIPAPEPEPQPKPVIPEYTEDTNSGIIDVSDFNDPTEGKYWLKSITVWGAIITAMAAVLPGLLGVFGIIISAEEIKTIGQQGVEVLQALAALVGTVMVIVGRMRAAEPVTMRLPRRKK